MNTSELTDELTAVLADLTRVRGLPADHPDRAAWSERKASVVARLEAVRLNTPDQADDQA